MNEKAGELGLENTHFVTPHGLDKDEHYTTAYELAKMADYALNLEKFREVVATKSYTITINGYPKAINNTNELLGNVTGVYGVKTGFTNNAGRCITTSAMRDNFDIITVVLGADTKKFRTKDSIALIEYTYANYIQVNLRDIAETQFKEWEAINEGRIYINKGVKNTVKVKLNESKYTLYPVNQNEVKDIEIKINCTSYLEAPVAKNTVVGELEIKINEEIIESVEILVQEEIRKKEVSDYFYEIISNYDIILKTVLSR